MKYILTSAIACFVFFCTCAQERKITSTMNSPAEMDKFISELMGKMTLEEKIGQLNLVSVGFDITGPIVSKNVEEKILKGNVGGEFNTFTPVGVKKRQERAGQKSGLQKPR